MQRCNHRGKAVTPQCPAKNRLSRVRDGMPLRLPTVSRTRKSPSPPPSFHPSPLKNCASGKIHGFCVKLAGLSLPHATLDISGFWDVYVSMGYRWRTLDKLTAPMSPLGSQTCAHRPLVISFNPPGHSGYVHHDGNYHRGAGFWAPSQAAT